jgi:predicted acyltransferase
MPLNKKIGSVSYIFFSSGFSGLTLIALYYLLDVIDKPYLKKMSVPFKWFGNKII